MRTIINGFAAAAILIAAPALAETKPGTPTPAAGESSEQAAAQDKRYCAKHSATGSRIAKKVCKTRAQWIDEDGFDPLAQK
ncbi:hypothetical protein M9978_14810 [Sphingomonas sp. MG17]|jgi:hypothetical protein|uniref:PsiF repeat-containing protein n=1 Tax=Sphingomonas tagetis TaxID=2949092 RepID=A0A9X2KMP9_9SPHN|nr:hypothetical protein [Sphingomonas tagetis]MCP3731696.1 hypothetical protein [Sphingomonas tagetis]